jgi:hypothetical protein
VGESCAASFDNGRSGSAVVGVLLAIVLSRLRDAVCARCRAYDIGMIRCFRYVVAMGLFASAWPTPLNGHFKLIEPPAKPLDK